MPSGIKKRPTRPLCARHVKAAVYNVKSNIPTMEGRDVRFTISKLFMQELLRLAGSTSDSNQHPCILQAQSPSRPLFLLLLCARPGAVPFRRFVPRSHIFKTRLSFRKPSRIAASDDKKRRLKLCSFTMNLFHSWNTLCVCQRFLWTYMISPVLYDEMIMTRLMLCKVFQSSQSSQGIPQDRLLLDRECDQQGNRHVQRSAVGVQTLLAYGTVREISQKCMQSASLHELDCSLIPPVNIREHPFTHTLSRESKSSQTLLTVLYSQQP